MSVKVKKNQFNEDELKKITRELTVFPTSIMKVKGKMREVQGNPIFNFDNESSAEYIYLPYDYCNKYFKKKLNFENKYPKREIQFTKTLRDYQEEIAEDSMKMLKKEGAMILALATGMGKTCMSVYLASKISLPTIVVITKQTLLTSWKKTFEEFTDQGDNVWVVGEENKKNPRPEKIPAITICMEKRICKIPEEWLSKYGVFVIDEAHEWTSIQRAKLLLMFNPLYILACTATPTRSDKTFCVIEHICGKDNILRKINQKPFTVYKVDTSISVPIVKNAQGNLDWNDLVNKLAVHEKRNRMIIDIVSKNLDRKIIIMTSRVEHTSVLKTMLDEKQIDNQVLSGKVKKINDCNVLIASTSKASTGFDLAQTCENFEGRDLDMMIIAMSTKSGILIEQIAGRCRGKEPVYYYLVDNLPTIKNHYQTAQRWYKSRNGTIKMYKFE